MFSTTSELNSQLEKYEQQQIIWKNNPSLLKISKNDVKENKTTEDLVKEMVELRADPLDFVDNSTNLPDNHKEETDEEFCTGVQKVDDGKYILAIQLEKYLTFLSNVNIYADIQYHFDVYETVIDDKYNDYIFYIKNSRNDHEGIVLKDVKNYFILRSTSEYFEIENNCEMVRKSFKSYDDKMRFKLCGIYYSGDKKWSSPNVKNNIYIGGYPYDIKSITGDTNSDTNTLTKDTKWFSLKRKTEEESIRNCYLDNHSVNLPDKCQRELNWLLNNNSVYVNGKLTRLDSVRSIPLSFLDNFYTEIHPTISYNTDKKITPEKEWTDAWKIFRNEPIEEHENKSVEKSFWGMF